MLGEQITIRLDDGTLRRADVQAKRLRVTQSAYLRWAIGTALRRHESATDKQLGPDEMIEILTEDLKR